MTGPLVCRGRADGLPWRDGVAQACVTSPPYWGLRRYGDHPDELGTEDLHVYLSRLVVVMAEVRRVLRADGLAWVNIADTAAGSGGAGGDYLPPDRRAPRPEGSRGRSYRSRVGHQRYRQARPTIWRKTRVYGEIELASLPEGQWCNVPGRLVTALQDDGWRLRAWVTWAKTTTSGTPLVRPESLAHANRPGVSSEAILLLAPGASRSRFDPAGLVEAGDVWHFPPVHGPAGRGHAAPFPDELARRCILPSTRRGDLVVDPFHGDHGPGRGDLGPPVRGLRPLRNPGGGAGAPGAAARAGGPAGAVRGRRLIETSAPAPGLRVRLVAAGPGGRAHLSKGDSSDDHPRRHDRRRLGTPGGDDGGLAPGRR